MMNKDEIFNSILETLNEAYSADPNAIHALICNRVPCNLRLADHPTIQVKESNISEGEYNVGLLGIINGICEPLTGKRISSAFDDTKFVGFVEYTP